MKENKIREGLKRMAPLLGLAVAGFGLAFFCSPDEIIKHLRKQYKGTFHDLVNNSNESDEVKIYLEYIPDGDEQIVAKWINDSMAANSSKIAVGKVKPHHVMFNVLYSANSLIQSGRGLKNEKQKK